MNYLDITNFSCGYSKGFRLQPFHLALPKSSFAGILGRNGSGKSTLFKGLAGDLPPLSGDILLDGVSLTGLSPKELARRVAVVSQFIQPGPVTVEEYVMMGRIPYRRPLQFSYTDEDIAVAGKCMAMAGIDHLNGTYMAQLSGGELQRAAIASALAQQPALLLLDESTAHLDITYQVKVMDMLQQLSREEGLTVVMIIHDLNMASEYCTHLTLMKNGTVLHQGTPQEVLTRAHIEEAYETAVAVQYNPISGKPAIFPLSARGKTAAV